MLCGVLCYHVVAVKFRFTTVAEIAEYAETKTLVLISQPEFFKAFENTVVLVAAEQQSRYHHKRLTLTRQLFV
ncbi:unknown [Ruminococcus sp. CAG:382]|nr:unknown [Ruminococcus sp. CAG:382]